MHRWQEIRRYVRFEREDEEALAAVAAVVRPRFPAIVTEFYDRILEHEGARRVLTEGEVQVERLKQTLHAWLEGVFTGPWDEAYYHVRSRIGRVHVRIGLEPRYMILAMYLVRWTLQTAVIAALRDDAPARLEPTMRAVAKICDVELAVMMETYHDAYSAQLKKQERLAAIGQLGASISHEVKNPLGVIASSVYALREHFRAHADERAAKHLDRISRNVEQANEIVTTLLDFLRSGEATRAEREWNALVAEAADGVLLPPGVRLSRRLSPEAGHAVVDPVQVGRVIANLLRNAVEATPEAGGVVELETRGDGAEVAVLVRDHGAGLPSDVLPQLFEPLFTTKPVGNGLGLALSKAIIEAHGGTIRARNAEGGGAEFGVALPRGRAAGAPPGEAGAGARR